jgi:hypothetical protein
MSKIMDPTGTMLFLKVSEVVYRYKPQEGITCNDIKMYYAISEINGEQFFNSK